MGGFLNIDGPLYRVCNIIYYLFLVNIMWFVFCMPIFTAGASTTATFYVMGKVVRGEDVSPVKDFWKGFKINFKQGCIVEIIIMLLYGIVYFNLNHLNIFESGLVRLIYLIIQLGILIPLVITTIYVFPILSRVNINTKKLFFSSIYIGTRHIITTIECLIVIMGMVLALMYVRFINGVVFSTFGALYALGISFIVQNTIKLYITPEPEASEIEDVL